MATKPRGPFGVAALPDEVKNRLVSRGGRPSDPSPTVRRLVPLKKQVWKRLQTQAEHLSGLGKPVSPGQLAAMLLEKSVDDMEPLEQESRTRERRPRRPIGLTRAPVLCDQFAEGDLGVSPCAARRSSYS